MWHCLVWELWQLKLEWSWIGTRDMFLIQLEAGQVVAIGVIFDWRKCLRLPWMMVRGRWGRRGAGISAQIQTWKCQTWENVRSWSDGNKLKSWMSWREILLMMMITSSSPRRIGNFAVVAWKIDVCVNFIFYLGTCLNTGWINGSGFYLAGLQMHLLSSIDHPRLNIAGVPTRILCFLLWSLSTTYLLIPPLDRLSACYGSVSLQSLEGAHVVSFNIIRRRSSMGLSMLKMLWGLFWLFCR